MFVFFIHRGYININLCHIWWWGEPTNLPGAILGEIMLYTFQTSFLPSIKDAIYEGHDKREHR
jgi:hypothetical protein